MTESKSLEAAADVLAGVRLLVLDVDGVLTDGRLFYGPDGEALKAFNVKDGLGIRMLMDSGVEVAIITARNAPALHARMRDLRVQHFYPGRPDKLTALEALVGELGLTFEQAAYVGDDVLDLPAMRRVGVPITVSDGHPDVKAEAQVIAPCGGGQGAVRAIADAILKAQGRYDAALARVFGDAPQGKGLDKA